MHGIIHIPRNQPRLAGAHRLNRIVRHPHAVGKLESVGLVVARVTVIDARLTHEKRFGRTLRVVVIDHQAAGIQFLGLEFALQQGWLPLVRAQMRVNMVFIGADIWVELGIFRQSFEPAMPVTWSVGASDHHFASQAAPFESLAEVDDGGLPLLKIKFNAGCEFLWARFVDKVEIADVGVAALFTQMD